MERTSERRKERRDYRERETEIWRSDLCDGMRWRKTCMGKDTSALLVFRHVNRRATCHPRSGDTYPAVRCERDPKAKAGASFQ